MRKAKPCYLCEQGVTRYGRKHGLRVEGLGMVDTACPVTKEQYDAMLRELQQVVLTLSAKGPPS